MNAIRSFVREKLRIARGIAADLRREFGSKLVAVGITGSVARGTAAKYSDIDMQVILKGPVQNPYRGLIVENTYCSLNFATRSDAIREFSRPRPGLPEVLGGFTKVRPLYDPKALFKIFEAKARHLPREVFRKSAELALLHSYEDFCRVKNAYLSGDDIVLRDNVHLITHSAVWVVASLNHASFVSDREIFKAFRRYRKLPREFDRIRELRYGNLNRQELFKTLMSFYLDLVDFSEKEGIRIPVDRRTLQEVSRA